jgi:hypothetical protein
VYTGETVAKLPGLSVPRKQGRSSHPAIVATRRRDFTPTILSRGEVLQQQPHPTRSTLQPWYLGKAPPHSFPGEVRIIGGRGLTLPPHHPFAPALTIESRRQDYIMVRRNNQEKLLHSSSLSGSGEAGVKPGAGPP